MYSDFEYNLIFALFAGLISGLCGVLGGLMHDVSNNRNRVKSIRVGIVVFFLVYLAFALYFFNTLNPK
jgi:hypothetical protein